RRGRLWRSPVFHRPLMNWRKSTRIWWPAARSASPIAAVVLPLPLPVQIITSPLRRERLGATRRAGRPVALGRPWAPVTATLGSPRLGSAALTIGHAPPWATISSLVTHLPGPRRHPPVRSPAAPVELPAGADGA